MFHEFNNELEKSLKGFLDYLATALPIAIDPKVFVSAVPSSTVLVTEARRMIAAQAGTIPEDDRHAMNAWLSLWFAASVLASLVKSSPDQGTQTAAVTAYEYHMAEAAAIQSSLGGAKSAKAKK